MRTLRTCRSTILTVRSAPCPHVHVLSVIVHSKKQMNNYIVRSYRDVIVITKFAITKFAIRRANKAQNIVMY